MRSMHVPCVPHYRIVQQILDVTALSAVTIPWISKLLPITFILDVCRCLTPGFLYK